MLRLLGAVCAIVVLTAFGCGRVGYEAIALDDRDGAAADGASGLRDGSSDGPGPRDGAIGPALDAGMALDAGTIFPADGATSGPARAYHGAFVTNVCVGGGECLATSTSTSDCSCPAGSTPVSVTTLVYFGDSGACIDKIDLSICVGAPGTGTDIEIPSDPCVSSCPPMSITVPTPSAVGAPYASCTQAALCVLPTPGPRFGGAFVRNTGGGCDSPNPTTGACGCPLGFVEKAHVLDATGGTLVLCER